MTLKFLPFWNSTLQWDLEHFSTCHGLLYLMLCVNSNRLNCVPFFSWGNRSEHSADKQSSGETFNPDHIDDSDAAFIRLHCKQSRTYSVFHKQPWRVWWIYDECFSTTILAFTVTWNDSLPLHQTVTHFSCIRSWQVAQIDVLTPHLRNTSTVLGNAVIFLAYSLKKREGNSLDSFIKSLNVASCWVGRSVFYFVKRCLWQNCNWFVRSCKFCITSGHLRCMSRRWMPGLN